ncbi:hypothetical protein GDI3585 [Gluconacetobacter diazotrophicus PA1 5]|uniref:Uncharacterized protein n=1 Tax=Gluconacetobacter diazotrophicus (strain ATCC 49037 / DSM 5601 / CCUG 37298 / CIP 103539 / LMG 7603 / PAl5) TaxID=272568 RepID=A9H6P5_GLUDA|nr:hypothetical protein GDI3585 [Gluconacetobacter diazotrophicus PA1 5]
MVDLNRVQEWTELRSHINSIPLGRDCPRNLLLIS